MNGRYIITRREEIDSNPNPTLSFFCLFAGDKARKYYVIDEGKLEVRLRAPGASDNMGEVNGGDVIHVYDASKVS